MTQYAIEYRNPDKTDGWSVATPEKYTSVEEAELRYRISDYDYRIVVVPEEKEVVKTFFRDNQKFEVGETYAHQANPDDFLYKIAYEFEDGRFLLVYDDPYNEGKLTSLKYQPEHAKFFVKKP